MLAVQLMYRSIASPLDTNIVFSPLSIADLHMGDDEAPGHTNVCTLLFGEAAGMRFDRWTCRWLRWLLVMAILLELAYWEVLSLLPSLIGKAAAAVAVSLTLLFLAVPMHMHVCIYGHTCMRV